MIEVETRGLIAKERLLAERQVTQLVTRKIVHDLANSVMPLGLAREYLLRLATSPNEKDRQQLIASLKTLETSFENTRSLIFVLRDTVVGTVKPNPIRPVVSEILGNVADFIQSGISFSASIGQDHAALMEHRRFCFLVRTILLNPIDALKRQPAGHDRQLWLTTSLNENRLSITVGDNRVQPFQAGEPDHLRGASMSNYEACRWLVEEHGGEFHVETEPGKVELTMDLPADVRTGVPALAAE